MEGGASPPGLVTVKMSVRHCVAGVYFCTAAVASTVGWPLMRVVVVATEIDGPVMLNEVKSSRIWLINCND